jgi:RNA polymerase sigma-70 factor (ECF subfamily)
MDLVKAAREGREAAFLRLFDEHHAPLFRFAYRLTGSAADAEDIVQECFLELLRPAGWYDPGRTAIRTYLFGVVRNQSLKRWRRTASQGENGREDGPGD